MSIFKACDVRGRYGDELTTELAEQLGLAIGTQLTAKRIVVGGDLRPSTAVLKGALIHGLLRTGCQVDDIGIVPTPTFYFAKKALHILGGVMVTGSHNPAGDNGFKITIGDCPITPAELETLRDVMGSGSFAQGQGMLQQVEVVERYEEALRQAFAPGGALHLVVDAGNGCYAEIAPRVLEQLGYRVTRLYCEPDGRFPNRSPNPSVASHLGALQQRVVEVGAHLGVAYDGDGDRAVFVDERGRFVESDRSIVLLARHLLQQQPGKIVYDLKCSSVVPEQVVQAGGIPIMERSGHAFIKTALLKTQALLGGEISGHFFFGKLGYDDALYATLMMLDILAASAMPLSAMVDQIPRYPITPDLRYPCPPDQAQAIIQELQTAFGNDPDCQVITLDGVRITWPDGWALVRSSVTEPLLTCRFEAHDVQRLAQIQRLLQAHSPQLAALNIPVSGPAA